MSDCERKVYQQKYYQQNREVLIDKVKYHQERGKKLYGKQVNTATRKYFVSDPIQQIHIEHRPITLTFD
jgi:hypothetical protein